MTFVRGLLGRLLAALLMAGGVVIVTSGLLAMISPASGYMPTPTEISSAEPTATPLGSIEPATSPSPTPGPTPVVAVAVASRVVVPALSIDLPVVAQTYGPGHGSYPLCDVAQYLEQFGQPSQPGTTYIYAHARVGMFLPLLTQWQRDKGKHLLGDLVQVYTEDGKLYLYEIFRAETAFDFALARAVPPGESWLILQTSTGPNFTFAKLMVAARLLNVADGSPAEANPTPHVRDCRK
jgi:hypothetical protein